MFETNYRVRLTVNGIEVDRWHYFDKETAYDRFAAAKCEVENDAGVFYTFGDLVEVTLDDGVMCQRDGFEKHVRHDSWQVTV